jgi:excisionase family DNA binding protein
MPAMPEQHVTASEAARILGVSRRTVTRRIADGTLRTVEVGNARRVVLEMPEDAQPGHGTTPASADGQLAQIAHLRAQLEAVTSERDHLRSTVDKLAGTVDRLTRGASRPAEARTAPLVGILAGIGGHCGTSGMGIGGRAWSGCSRTAMASRNPARLRGLQPELPTNDLMI